MTRALAALVALSACSEYQIDAPEPVTEEWTVRGNVDIVVYGDTSDSMADTLDTLTENITAFLDRLDESNTDWHLIAVTGPDGCAQGGVLTSDTPDWERKFREGITTKPGDTEADEWGLYNAAEAVAKSVEGECNEGFLRDDAHLQVVYISDEDDNSPGWDSGDPEYWRPYVGAYLDAKGGDGSLVHLSAVGGPEPTGCAYADFANGYWQAVRATEGAFLSICDNWPSQVAGLAETAVVQDRFTLTDLPRLESLEVFVDGEQRSEGWKWNDQKNVVTFLENPPFVGQTVYARYTPVLGLPE